MGPFTIGGSWIVNLLIGVGFGLALESSGFGDSRKIAGQFYLTELTVLKVMFTAIVVAAVLVFGSASVGLLDYQAIWVDPTFLWTGVVGGLIMGAGFVIGGYCPGTSLVSASTGKIDGMFFVGGVAVGAALFGETVGLFRGWWETGGAGRVTLQGLLGVDAGVVVLGVVLLALFLFWGGERLRDLLGHAVPAAPRVNVYGAGVLAVLALLVAAHGQPGPAERFELLASKYAPKLERREVQIEPVELASLINDDGVALQILDVRDDASWNLFHLADARRLDPARIDAHPERFMNLPPNAVLVLVDNDERKATGAWKHLMAVAAPNAYVLAGGMNAWLDHYGETHAASVAAAGGPDDPLRHAFTAAVGDRDPAARPYHVHGAGEDFEHKVHLAVKRAAAGGCG